MGVEMKNNLKKTLLEIEEIIAKIGVYNLGNIQSSRNGKSELIRSFKAKIKAAKIINEKLR